MRSTEPGPIRWSVVVIATLATILCLTIALRRVRVESDLTASIPAGSPVLDSGRRLLSKHPIIDWIAIDISLRDGSSAPDRLVAAAEQVELGLTKSGLFSRVGTADYAAGFAALQSTLVERLPTLFSETQLRTLVAPRLEAPRVRASVQGNYAKLGELDGIGQADAIAGDPLGLRELIYPRLGALVPKSDARIEHNQLLSADGAHVLVTAVPHHALGDPESSRRIAAGIDAVGQSLATQATPGQSLITLTAAGAYRAAMDNEAIVKSDTNRAVWLVTIALALLLLTCFADPVLGLLTLLPATAGVATALLVYSWFASSMSALSLGFGAALISITVDQGIVYIAYLDRVQGASGKQAAKQTFSAVSLATLTTVGAFLALKFSGYSLLEELGVFAALGSAFSFAFVHTVFPLVFRRAPRTLRRPILPIDTWLRRLASGPIWTRLVVALVLFVGLGAFARPHFEVDLERLNTVTADTRAAEQRVRRVWGDLFSRAYVLAEAPSVDALQQQTDALFGSYAREIASGGLVEAFSPSLVWPGPNTAAENLRAWKAFWDPQRRAQVRALVLTTAKDVGFTDTAFDPFFRLLEFPRLETTSIPQDAYSLLGIERARDGHGWVWLGVVHRGPSYDAKGFARRMADAGFTVFDGTSFRLGLNEFLGNAFLRMLLIVAPFVIVAVGLSFLNLRLIALVLAPVAFALTCTLGTFGLLKRPIDIPGLMLGVVVLGMGTNFSVYLARAHQRFPAPDHPAHDSVRVAALLDGGATVLGMGVLLAASHAAAKSAGLAGLLGIGFSLAAALILLPPALRAWVPIGGPWDATPGSNPTKRVWSRFRYLEPRPLLFAFHALFLSRRLRELSRAVPRCDSLLVLGCSYGTESAYLLASDRVRQVYCIESDSERARVAGTVLAERGRIVGNDLTNTASLDVPVDAALLLEATLRLPHEQQLRLLQGLHSILEANGQVIWAASSRGSEDLLTAMALCGFELLESNQVGYWLVATRVEPRSTRECPGF